MSFTKRLSRSRPNRKGRERGAAIERVRSDPAVRAADPAARKWLLQLLAQGERAELTSDGKETD